MSFLLVRLVSLGLVSFAITVLASPQTVAAAQDGRYVDQALGFSFSKPHFAPSEEKDVATVAITLAGPPAGGFAPNVNVVVHNLETTLDAYEQLQREQLGAIGWKLLDQSQSRIGGRTALRTHARGSLQGVQVEVLAVAMVEDEKKVFVLTCTASAADFPLYQAEFEKVVASFSLEP